MNKKTIFPFLLALIGLGQCLAQVPDSIRRAMQPPVFQQDTLPVDSLMAVADTTATLPLPTDSVPLKKQGLFHRVFKSDYPNPNKALYLSLAFPAGGQLYNRRWWKAPIVWGGYVGLIYAARHNTRQYKRLQKAYLAEIHNELHEFTGIYDKGDLKRYRDQFDKNKQLSYIGMFGLHLLQTAEAFVDCHLKTFDVSDDLSLHFKPSLEPSFASQYPVMGMGLAFSFGK
jgi:Family of unknown function (DUF5683)